VTNARLDATAMADLVERRESTPVELVESAIRQIDSLNPTVNAVIVPLYDQAIAEADSATGPFRGVPYVLKDMNVAKGAPHASGIEGVKRAGYVSDHDSYFVQSMRAAGFVLVGISNTSEMGLSPTTEPRAWGPTRNPWNLEYSVGGSSGGSAAAVAADMVPIAHGTDSGGSCRIPASACGVVGLKPTRGRVSNGPSVRFSDELSGHAHQGVLARSVRDAAAVLDAVGGQFPGDTYRLSPPQHPFASQVGWDSGALRIGVLAEEPTGQVDTDPDCRELVLDTAAVLRGLGHRVEEAFPAALTKGRLTDEFAPCISVAAARELDAFATMIGRPLTEDDVEPFTWQWAQRAPQVTGTQYAAGVDAVRRWSREIQTWWEDDGWDLLLTPTVATLPPRLGEFARQADAGNLFEFAIRFTAMTDAYNATGQPAISLPVGMSKHGLPIGVQLVAAYGRDDLALRVAAQLEAAMPWADREPRPLPASS
jgi:Asp-tRNA(Asn)/Glu-tRNA(Gln) amidotransferase A subunit family amidase